MNIKQLQHIRQHLIKSLELTECLMKELGLEVPPLAPEKSNEPLSTQKASETKKPKKAKRKLPVDVDNPDWPHAIPESVIVKTDSQKWARANTILTKFQEMEGPALDFGCGDGHITIVMSDQKIPTIGYDIRESRIWNRITSDENIFTTDWNTVVEKGPYKSILLHDVIDHVEEESIEELLNKVATILDDHGFVYIMAHPFSSRHGGHLYEHINKAYIHLLLNDEEIAEYDGIPSNQFIIKPQGQYQKYFTKDFVIVEKKVVPQPIEPWVSKNLIPHIKEIWFPDMDTSKVEKVLQIGGIYYTLKKIATPI